MPKDLSKRSSILNSFPLSLSLFLSISHSWFSLFFLLFRNLVVSPLLFLSFTGRILQSIRSICSRQVIFHWKSHKECIFTILTLHDLIEIFPLKNVSWKTMKTNEVSHRVSSSWKNIHVTVKEEKKITGKELSKKYRSRLTHIGRSVAVSDDRAASFARYPPYYYYYYYYSSKSSLFLSLSLQVFLPPQGISARLYLLVHLGLFPSSSEDGPSSTDFAIPETSFAFKRPRDLLELAFSGASGRQLARCWY